MDTRKPLYKDLLKYISPENLNAFMGQLILRKTRLKATESDEVDSGVFLKKGYLSESLIGDYFLSALDFAISIYNVEMVDALLKIGSDPNINDKTLIASTPLLRAMSKSKVTHHKKEENNLILDKLLEAKADIYVTNQFHHTPFALARGNTSLILKMLNTDETLDLIPQKEKETLIGTMRVHYHGYSEKSKKHNEVIYKTMNYSRQSTIWREFRGSTS